MLLRMMKRGARRLNAAPQHEMVKRTAADWHGGKRCEESHHSAKLTAELVEAIRQLHEDPDLRMGYIALRDWLEVWHGVRVTRNAVRWICLYRTWASQAYRERADARRKRRE